MAAFYTRLRMPSHVTTSAEPFTRKQDHLELMWDVYHRAKAGQTGMILLIGEPGIGKTYLLKHIAARATQEGATILQGHASATEGMPPYLPFLEALGQYIRNAPVDQLREQTALAPEALATILPELSTRLGELPTSYSQYHDQRRLRLYEAIGAFLEAMSMAHPVVLVLDDLHLADAESLALLCHIACHHPSARLLIIGAYREGEQQRNPALVHTITELTRQRILRTLKLQPLSLSDVESLALNYLGQPLTPAVTLLLYAQSEGNPFFAEELLQCWMAMGAITQESGQWTLAASLDGLLPSSIINTRHHQLAQLSMETIKHLQVAAIIGRSFDVSLLAAVEGQEVEVVEEHLLGAVQTRLVQSDGAGTFRFSHRNIQEYLYHEEITSRRKRLHRLIAETLEARSKQDQPASSKQLAELASHFARSGDRARGIMYAQSAAAQALQEYVFQEIAALFWGSPALVPARKAPPGDLVSGIGNLPFPAGMREETQPPYDSADTWLALVSNLEAAACSAQELGLVEWWQEALLAAQGAMEHALTFLEERPSPGSIQALIDATTPLAYQLRYTPEGNTCAERLLALAHCLAEDHAKTVTYPVMSESAPWCSGVVTSRLRSLERVLTLIETSEHSAETTECWLYLAVVYFLGAEIKRSYEVTLHWARCNKHSQQSNQLSAAYAWLSSLHVSQGAWTEAEQAFQQALSSTASTAHPEMSSLLHCIRGFLACQREDYSVAGQEFQALLAGSHSNVETSIFCAPLLSLIFINTGKQDEAKLFTAKLEALLTRLPSGTLSTLPLLLAQALLAVALGERKQAITLYQHLLPFEGQYCWLLVDRVLGAIATLSGDWQAAEMYLASAETTALREGLLPELARTFQGRADLELAWGKEENTTQARGYLAEALALFERLALYQAADVVRNRLGLPPHRRDEMKTAPLPAGLTRREVAVLRLVAEGKSNYQIAQRLSLSEKTVANHLTTIFHKTASENRAAAVAFAIRHDLV